jgi:hypothetical protein
MQGIIQNEVKLDHADLPEVRRVLTELIRECRYRFSTLSKENFGEKELKGMAEALIPYMEIKDGKIVVK